MIKIIKDVPREQINEEEEQNKKELEELEKLEKLDAEKDKLEGGEQ